MCGGSQVWSKAQGSGPCPVGVRGFKSLPPHETRAQITKKCLSILSSIIFQKDT